jgi:hypothetical protein
MTARRFQVSSRAQTDFRVLGDRKPSTAESVARKALSAATNHKKADAVHVVQRKDGWAVKTERRERAASIEPTKEKAVRVARAQASAQGARLIEHSTSGRIAKNTKPGAPATKRKK